MNYDLNDRDSATEFNLWPVIKNKIPNKITAGNCLELAKDIFRVDNHEILGCSGEHLTESQRIPTKRLAIVFGLKILNTTPIFLMMRLTQRQTKYMQA